MEVFGVVSRNVDAKPDPPCRANLVVAASRFSLLRRDESMEEGMAVLFDESFISRRSISTPEIYRLMQHEAFRGLTRNDVNGERTSDRVLGTSKLHPWALYPAEYSSQLQLASCKLQRWGKLRLKIYLPRAAQQPTDLICIQCCR